VKEPLIRRGYVRQVLDKGVSETTKFLSDKRVAHVHLTGSRKSEKAVMKALSLSRPSCSQSQIREMISSELGCVTPVIVIPGHYEDKELAHAARIITFVKKANGGSNCASANAIILPQDWDQKEAFRKSLIQEFERGFDHPAYYPGAREKRDALMKHYLSLGEDRATVVEGKKSIGIKRNSGDCVVLLECGTPSKDNFDGTALTQEAFCPALAVVELQSQKHNTEEYMENAVVPFLNNKENIYGSLSCMIISPKSVSDDVIMLEKTISLLQYGTVAINSPTLFGYEVAMAGGTWGGHHQEFKHESGESQVSYVVCLCFSI